MTEFVQTMWDWHRMCAEMHNLYPLNSCDGCRLERDGCPIIRGVNSNSVDFGNVEKVVKAWAAENPEPVYPTWGEWLSKTYHMPSSRLLGQNIPDDMAKKLGVKLEAVKRDESI